MSTFKCIGKVQELQRKFFNYHNRKLIQKYRKWVGISELVTNTRFWYEYLSNAVVGVVQSLRLVDSVAKISIAAAALHSITPARSALWNNYFNLWNNFYNFTFFNGIYLFRMILVFFCEESRQNYSILLFRTKVDFTRNLVSE